MQTCVRGGRCVADTIRTLQLCALTAFPANSSNSILFDRRNWRVASCRDHCSNQSPRICISFCVSTSILRELWAVRFKILPRKDMVLPFSFANSVWCIIQMKGPPNWPLRTLFPALDKADVLRSSSSHQRLSSTLVIICERW